MSSPPKKRAHQESDTGHEPRQDDHSAEVPGLAEGRAADSDERPDHHDAAEAHGPHDRENPESGKIVKKKRRRLPFEKLFLASLPASLRYSQSLMHREQICFNIFTPITEFLITASTDGVVKFWKKLQGEVKFIREFHAHASEITTLSVSADGRSLATSGPDKTVKIFDIPNFDLLYAFPLTYTASHLCWIHSKSASIPLLAIAAKGEPLIYIYDGRGGTVEPIHTLKHIHRCPTILMSYNNEFDCVVSADEGGMLEYWRPSGNFEKPDNVFELKSSTNLFVFKKLNRLPSCISISPTGQHFATYSFPDQLVRIFDFATGKLVRTYDESIDTNIKMQQDGSSAEILEEVEFGRRLAVERELENSPTSRYINIVFDETGNFIFYGSILGIKVINIVTNRVMRVYGKDEPFRPVNISLYQGQPEKKSLVTIEMAASENPILMDAETRDAVLVTSGVNRVRFYMFTNDKETSKNTRDVQNERALRINVAQKPQVKATKTGTSAVLHTTYGDIHIRLFPDAAPKAVENFVTHARNGYYNNVIFHRVIRKFMIQTGDPLGDGTGGDSIWGKEFEDEFSTLKHDKPYTVSMANAGPNSNGSQFFITTEKTPWLDKKHTIFGRAIQGLDVIHRIENVKVYKERPEEEIRIISIDVNV